MTGVGIFFGFLCGCFTILALQFIFRDQCEHEYIQNYITKHQELGGDGEYHVVAQTKHYECKKCFKVKSVRIG